MIKMIIGIILVIRYILPVFICDIKKEIKLSNEIKEAKRDLIDGKVKSIEYCGGLVVINY